MGTGRKAYRREKRQARDQAALLARGGVAIGGEDTGKDAAQVKSGDELNDARSGEEEESAMATAQLATLRIPGSISFDTARHALRQAVATRLGLPPDTDLGSLKRLDGDGASGGGPGGRGPGTEWNRRWKRCNGDGEAKFREAYLDLLRHVILPHISDPRGLCFQRDPTFRAHVPGGCLPLGTPHKDADYGHSRSEINFWLPLSRSFGSNSLYAESAPGLGDYTAFDLRYGEVMRFWGNQCNHYTMPNETGVARVSLDFRVVPRSVYIDEHESEEILNLSAQSAGQCTADGIATRDSSSSSSNSTADITPRVGRDGAPNSRFSLGQFFWWMDAEGRVVTQQEQEQKAGTRESAVPPPWVPGAGWGGKECEDDDINTNIIQRS
jgi:hypothetical protein